MARKEPSFSYSIQRYAKKFIEDQIFPISKQGQHIKTKSQLEIKQIRLAITTYLLK